MVVGDPAGVSTGICAPPPSCPNSPPLMTVESVPGSARLMAAYERVNSHAKLDGWMYDPPLYTPGLGLLVQAFGSFQTSQVLICPAKCCARTPAALVAKLSM